MAECKIDYMYLRGVKIDIAKASMKELVEYTFGPQGWWGKIIGVIIRVLDQILKLFTNSAFFFVSLEKSNTNTIVKFTKWLTVGVKLGIDKAGVCEAVKETKIGIKKIEPIFFSADLNLFEIEVQGSPCEAILLSVKLTEHQELKSKVNFAEPQFDGYYFKTNLPLREMLDLFQETMADYVQKMTKPLRHFLENLSGSGAAMSGGAAKHDIDEPAINIAVIDSGFNHSRDLYESVSCISTRHFNTDRELIESYRNLPRSSHGTKCAQVATLKSSSSTNLLLIAASGRDIAKTQTLLARSIAFAANYADANGKGVDIITCSIGSTTYPHFPMQSILKLAIDLATNQDRGNKGIPIFFAAPYYNSRYTFVSDQVASYPKIISVGAVDNNDRIISVMEGCPLDIMTLGRHDVSKETISGNSYAAPFAANFAGRLLRKRPDLTARQIHAIMRLHTRLPKGSSGTLGEHHPNYGYGIVKVEEVPCCSSTDSKIQEMVKNIEEEEKKWAREECERIKNG